MATRLFQYGSNMSEPDLRSKIDRHMRHAPEGISPDVTLLGAARLSGWRFALDLYSARGKHRVADIFPSDAANAVWGALYELPLELVRRSDGRRSVLDRIEGHQTEVDPENYQPCQVTVEFAGEHVQAWTYVGGDAARERCLHEHNGARVSPAYSQAIIEGARALPVPADYLETLQQILAAHR